MEEHLIWSENSASKRHFLKNDVAFYLILLFLVFGIITFGNYMLKRFNAPRLYIQLGLYAILFAVAVFVYRRYLVEYRYILTDRMMNCFIYQIFYLLLKENGDSAGPGDWLHTVGIAIFL